MYEDWSDIETARPWSADTTGHNPVRTEQLDILLSVLEGEYKPGSAILDMGMGSGLVEALIFERMPTAYVVGLDFSDAMIRLANERLAPFRGKYEVVMHDLKAIKDARLPAREYSVAISVQTIHNVPHEHKRAAFRFIYDALSPGGLFLLLDRIAIDTPSLFDCYDSIWRRQERVYNAHPREGSTFKEHVESVATRGDLPASLEEHLQWLRDAGFEAACLHLHANRALFAARRV
jgi:ubiquinone/menaquinone biosynthesis C-methylase UbiE